MFNKLWPLALAAVLAQPVIADEAAIKKAIEEKFGTPVASVVKSPYLGLYEVYAAGKLFYVDEKQTVFIFGSLTDAKTMKNVTAERMQQLNEIKFSELPLDLAIKQVRGDGSRVFASFEDPNCGFCKKLSHEIVKLDNITFYTFILPMLSADSLEKTKKVWCSSNRVKTWNDWMRDGKTLPGNVKCNTNDIQKTVELARKLAITGVPTLVFTDGDRMVGMVPAEAIEEKLKQAAAAK